MTNIDITSIGEPASREGAGSLRIAFITLGCAKNEVDSAEMVKRVASAGYELCEDPEAADAVIVNTCSFI